jgi:O-antigen/teichoic acid export membrane protein
MLNRVIRNFGVVIRGRGIAGVFSVLATGLMANALSATEFGLVVLLHTYIMVIRGALNFKTFEAVVRFGIPLNDSGDEAGFRALLRTTMLVDWVAAIVATLVGIMAASLAADLLDWEPVMVSWAAVYSLIILTTANGTSNGILRVYDRFDAIGVQLRLRLHCGLSQWPQPGHWMHPCRCLSLPGALHSPLDSSTCLFAAR